MLASEAALDVLALTVVVLCVLGVLLGVAIVSRAWRRVRLYRAPGSRRAYARQQFVVASCRLAMTALFLATGLVLSFMEDGNLRSGIARLLVLAIVVILVSLQVFDPISQSRIEYMREREIEEEKP